MLGSIAGLTCMGPITGSLCATQRVLQLSAGGATETVDQAATLLLLPLLLCPILPGWM
jgi:hypothetical protein